jgi:hypothetical protein
VYRNDPIPTVPYEEVLTFYHSGTEIHFYDCVNAYIAYPFQSDDTPMTLPGNMGDHSGYFCLEITESNNKNIDK